MCWVAFAFEKSVGVPCSLVWRREKHANTRRATQRRNMTCPNSQTAIAHQTLRFLEVFRRGSRHESGHRSGSSNNRMKGTRSNRKSCAHLGMILREHYLQPKRGHADKNSVLLLQGRIGPQTQRIQTKTETQFAHILRTGSMRTGFGFVRNWSTARPKAGADLPGLKPTITSSGMSFKGGTWR